MFRGIEVQRQKKPVCRKGLQERAVIGTVQIIIRALIRIYAAVGPPP